MLSILDQKVPPTGAVVVLSNPRVSGKNLAYDVRTLKGSLAATGIDGTLLSMAVADIATQATTEAIQAIRVGRRRRSRMTPRNWAL